MALSCCRSFMRFKLIMVVNLLCGFLESAVLSVAFLLMVSLLPCLIEVYVQIIQVISQQLSLSKQLVYELGAFQGYASKLPCQNIMTVDVVSYFTSAVHRES